MEAPRPRESQVLEGVAASESRSPAPCPHLISFSPLCLPAPDSALPTSTLTYQWEQQDTYKGPDNTRLHLLNEWMRDLLHALWKETVITPFLVWKSALPLHERTKRCLYNSCYLLDQLYTKVFRYLIAFHFFF